VLFFFPVLLGCKARNPSPSKMTSTVSCGDPVEKGKIYSGHERQGIVEGDELYVKECSRYKYHIPI